MPWWGWLLIWLGLGLALVAMLVLGAIWLWRKSLGLLDEAGKLADRLSVFEGVDDEPPPRAVPAILRDLESVRNARAIRVARRIEFKRVRRSRRLERARRITSLDASAVRWPKDWYRS